MKDYIVNIETIALVPLEENITQVYEVHGEFCVPFSTTYIIEQSCRYYGSSLDGRKKGTESLIGIKYKAPIIVEESNDIILFPMSSIRDKDTIWLRLSMIEKYMSNRKGVNIIFKNDKNFFVASSYGILDNQILRATRLESALRARKNAKKTF